MYCFAKRIITLLVKNHKAMSKWLVVVLAAVSLVSCIKFGEHYNRIPPGIWRGVLVLSDELEGFDEKSKGELPFNFEVIYDTPDSFHIVIQNGEERIIVNDIQMGVDRRTARDTIRIGFPVYDSYIQAQYEEDAIEGWWIVNNRKDYRIKFRALHAQPYRFFQTPEPPVADLTGKWDCTFAVETDSPSKAIGEFVQKGNLITGTFMAPTGDDRFLEGVVNGDRLHLSVFDGSHAYLYEAKILPDGQLTGIYRSGNHFKTYWEGHRSDSITLKDLGDPYTLTQMKSDEAFALALRQKDGSLIDISKGIYAGKPKIIQIMGTWCPNCKDETTFLTTYLANNPDPGFEVIGVSFERHTDTTKAIAAIETYKQKMNIPYPVIYGGSNDKEKAGALFPMLNKVVAYPTLIFLNGDNQVVAIHTGFSGPATSGYASFQQEFTTLVSKIQSR
jgi:thiol-disulfide isomerase/thioredoxin